MTSIRLTFSIFVIFTLFSTTAVAQEAYPEPRPAPDRWELNFLPGDLRVYVDPVEQKPYWYFTYTVENRTGDEQIWAPRFVLYTDAGELMRSGVDVPTRVTSDVIDMLGNDLLMNQNEVIGEIRQGREHAREGVVIWPFGDISVTEISLFISGVSGETAEVTNPITGERILLRKTLQREYLVPGNPIARGSRPVRFQDDRWIFR